MNINWKQWKKIKGEIGLYFVCQTCSNDALIHPGQINDSGTPVCPDCDVDMLYEGAYIKQK